MSNAFIQALLMDDPDVGGGEVDPDFPGGCTGDPDWADVVLALNFESADGSTTLVDSSTYADSQTVYSGGTVRSAAAKFGPGGFRFDQISISADSWAGTKFNGVAGEGTTIEFWFKPVARYAGTAAPTFFKLQDATTANALIEMGLYSTGNNITIRFEQAPSDFRQYGYTVDVNGWVQAVVCVGAAGGARVYLNQTLVVSRPNSEVFATGAFGNPSTGCRLYFGSWGSGPNATALTCYVDQFRYTAKDKYPSGVPTPSTTPFCNGTGDISPINRSGTEALRGIGMTAAAGNVNLIDGHKKLSGQEATAGAGSVSLFSPNKTAALLGQTLTASRGTLSRARYPNLIISASRHMIRVPWAGATITVRVFFNSDGTCTQQIDGGAITAFREPYWAFPYDGRPNATTRAIPVSSVPNAFKQTTNRVPGDGGGNTTEIASNTTMAGGCVLTVIRRRDSDETNIDVMFAPTTLNPRYGEVGYYGTIKLAVGT